MKKILLTMGTIASVATPVAAVVSCGSKTAVHTQPGTDAQTPGGQTPDGGEAGGGGSHHHISGMHINVAGITKYKTTACIVPITSDAYPSLDQIPTAEIEQIATALSANTIAMASQEIIFKVTVENEFKYYILELEKGEVADVTKLEEAFGNAHTPTTSIPQEIGGAIPTVTLDEINAALVDMPDHIESLHSHSALYAKGAIKNGGGAEIQRQDAGIPHDFFNTPNGMEIIYHVKAALPQSEPDFTVEAKMFSLADPTIFATKDIVVTSLSDARGADYVDLTQAKEEVWHALFRNGLVRRLPSVDQTLFIDIDGTNYGFTWTAADAAHETPSGFMHNDDHAQHHTQIDMLNYLARRIVAANPGHGLTAWKVFESFGVTYHDVSHLTESTLEVLQNIPTTGLKAGAALPESKARMFNLTRSANPAGEQWHIAFREEIDGHFERVLPRPGSTIWVRLGNKDYGMTWTNDDTNMQVARDFLKYKTTGSQVHIASYIAQRIKVANPTMTETALQIFTAMGLAGLPGKHGLAYVTTTYADMPTEGVRDHIHLPYEFDADFAKVPHTSTKTMAEFKAAVDASNDATTPVPLTADILGITIPSLSSGFSVTGLEAKSYTDGETLKLLVTMKYEQTSFTREIEVEPSDLPYDFTADIAKMNAATFTTTMGAGDITDAFLAAGDDTAATLSITGEPANLSSGTTVTYSGTIQLGLTSSSITATLKNGTFTQDVTITLNHQA